MRCSILLLLLISANPHLCLAGNFFNFNNTITTGKITIDGKDISSNTNTGNVIQGNGHFTKKRQQLSDFTIIKSNTAVDIIYTAGKPSLQIAADENILPFIRVKQHGKSVIIETTRSFSTANPVQIRLSSSKLDKGSFYGAGDISLHKINNNHLQLSLTGTGDLIASGKVNTLELSVKGSGDVNTKSLIAKHVTVISEGAADITLTATKTLNVHQSGIGDIIFFGNPETVRKQTSGIGEIVSGQ
jgi:hypothetical protein